MPSMSKLNVLFVASEADPLVKVGGLGDVAGSLPSFLRQIPPGTDQPELDVRLVIPYHPSVRQKLNDASFLTEFMVPHPNGPLPAQVFQTEVNGVPIFLVSGAFIPEEGPVYSPDHRVDALKYIFFSLAVLELPKALNWPIDILHANDWHTAISPYVLSIYKKEDPFFQNTGSLLSIHNLPFMGAGAEKVVSEFGIPPVRVPRMPVWSW